MITFYLLIVLANVGVSFNPYLAMLLLGLDILTSLTKLLLDEAGKRRK